MTYDVWTPQCVQQLLREWGPPTQPNHSRHTRLIQRIAQLIGDNVSVLDVGCGMGHLYFYLQGHVTQYLGLDQSRHMVNVANASFHRSVFDVGNVYDLSMFNQYDVVVAVGLLRHLHMIEPALIELWHHTKHRLLIEVVEASNEHVYTSHQSYAPKQTLIQRTITQDHINQLLQRFSKSDKIMRYPFEEYPLGLSVLYVITRESKHV